MAFVGLQLAGAVSAQPNTVPNPFAPQPFWQWQKIDQGNKYFQNNWRNPWDDQKLNYKTYKFKWRDNNVKIYMQLYNKTRVNTWQRWRWSLNKSTIKSLDKTNWRTIRINTLTYNSTGNLTNNTNRYVFTRFDPVRYYWNYKDKRDPRHPFITPLIQR